MSSDFEAYEQDFGTITADVTNKIGRIPKLSGEEKTQLVLNVDKQLEEVRELLEQMDLEVREIPIQSRAMYNSRLKSYKQEMEKLEKDFTGPESTSLHRDNRGDRGGLRALGHDKQALQQAEGMPSRPNGEERKQVGQEILANLHTDREKIQRARERRVAPHHPKPQCCPSSHAASQTDRGPKPQVPHLLPCTTCILGSGNLHRTSLGCQRLRETDANLGKSSRILTGMLRR
ncbi:vesicle transport through interaction with t-SNAREs homolog 1A [Stegastes partitus]|uniref:Vesicle transport through interaction with t-SNAREs homolog 1A n=1 Tax=Stegastes partitus TaxID=144197 RepID=A0A9Y4MXL7_9TELE|nr:PREDICTED: vesicle transport through interaction with t-SNAREs homolog 1A [Stegastes partitus]